MELYFQNTRMVPICGKLFLAFSYICTAVGSTSEKEVSLHVQNRPIVTGCLDSCGYKNTQCVTECQVCVEAHSCGEIHTCKTCEKRVLAMQRAQKNSDPRSWDSGGKSLIHEGLRVKYLKAQQDLQDAQHNLMVAREGVITAQTSADYSSQERTEKTKELREAREKKAGAEKTVHRWSKKNAARLERAQRRLREAEQEAEEEYKKLKKLNAELRRAHRRVKKAKEEEADEKVLKKAEEEEWEARRRVEEEEQKVEDLENAVEKRKKEAKWVDKHLRKQVKGKQDDIEAAARELEEAEQREKKALQVLQNAKEAYVLEIKRSEEADDRVTRLEKQLEEHPLAGPSQKHFADQRASLRSMGLRSSVGLLFLLSCWIPV